MSSPMKRITFGRSAAWSVSVSASAQQRPAPRERKRVNRFIGVKAFADLNAQVRTHASPAGRRGVLTTKHTNDTKRIFTADYADGRGWETGPEKSTGSDALVRSSIFIRVIRGQKMPPSTKHFNHEWTRMTRKTETEWAHGT